MIESLLRSKFDSYFVAPMTKNKFITRPNVVTLLAMVFGLMVIPAMVYHYTVFALVVMLLSGYCDVLDGAVAREQNQQSDMGSFFDILGDRLVESSIIMGLFLYAPATRGLGCLLMMVSILLCITVFLLVGIFSEKESHKSFYYSPGLIERAEAFIFFGFMILYPSHFTMLAGLLSGLILLTVIQHVRQFLLFAQRPGV